MQRLTFVKAFVGVFAGEADASRYVPVSVLDEAVTTTVVRHPTYALQTFGSSECTASISTTGTNGCIKGRPFASNPGRASVDPDSPRVHAQLSELDGRFSLCALSTNTLVLATDLLGASGIFYHVDGSSRFFFASHLGLLVRALPKRPAVNDRGVASVLAGSCIVGSRTLYRGVSRLEAAQCLVGMLAVGAITCRISSYRDLVEALAPVQAGKTDRIEEFEALLTEAVTREVTSDNFGVMLSGGKDSRAVTQALVLSGHRSLAALTFGERRSADVRGARGAARRIGVAHRVLAYGDWTFETYAATIAALAGGSSGLQTAHQIAGYDQAAGFVGLAMVGYLGDALTGAHLPGKEQTIADVVFPFRTSWAPAFQTTYRTELAGLEEDLANRWAALSGLSPVQRALLLDLTIRQATWISSTFDLCDWHLPVCFPFYSLRLIRFCFNLPQEDLADQRFYNEWLRRSLERIHTKGDARLSAAWLLSGVTKRALRKAGRLTGLPRMPSLIDWDAHVKRSEPWLSALAETTEDERLRTVFKAQLGTREHVPMLLAAGVSLATRQ